MLISDFGLVFQICGFFSIIGIKVLRQRSIFKEFSKASEEMIWKTYVFETKKNLKKYYLPESIAISFIIGGLILQFTFWDPLFPL